MVDPSTYYETARMAVVVELAEKHGNGMWLVCAQRRQSAQFVSLSTVAWCDTVESAQALARMLVGVEITRDGAAIWPDGRTEPADPARPTDPYVSPDDCELDAATAQKYRKDRIADDQPESEK